MKRTIIILSIACFILAMLNVYQLFLVPYEYNIPRDALFKAWTNIQEIVLFILIGGGYTLLTGYIIRWRADVDWQRHRDVYYKFLNKDELKQLKEDKNVADEIIKQLEAENKKLSAHIKGVVEHGGKVLGNETNN